ncbi:MULTISPECIES: glucosaminidase domain-containing protein [Flavobacterium]|nr:glucosaminidase domain-containing protein [Flavobacterium sp. N1846]
MTKKFNDYKSHTVTRGETTQTICFRYGILESDLVLANPNIPLAKYGNGFFGPSTYKLDIKAGDNLRIPFYNEEKDKSGVKSIKGKSTVKVGVWENYKVAEWYAGTPLADRNETKVKWNLYYLKNGAAPEKVLEKEEGKIRFQEKAAGNKYKVVGYLHEPELNNASAKLVSVEPAEKREILNIKLSDVNNKPINGPLAYGNYVNVHVETTGMKGEYIYISLWEDDAKGGGHSSENKGNCIIKDKKTKVGSKGVAFEQFLLKPDFKKIANAHLAKGDKNEGSTHEYYATAYAPGLSKASDNVNVLNPDFHAERKKETEDHLKDKKTKPKPAVPDYQGPVGSKKAPQKPNSPANSTPVGISSIYITDEQGNKITKSAYGKKIRIYIDSSGLTGKKVRLWLYEHDYTDSNDELFVKDITITGNHFYESITLNSDMRKEGERMEFGEGDDQELFAQAKVLNVPSHIISKSLKADVTSNEIIVAESTTVAKVGDSKIKQEKFDPVKEYGEEAVIYITSIISSEIKVGKKGKIESYPDLGGFNGQNENVQDGKIYCKKIDKDTSAYPTYKAYIYRGNKNGEAIKKLKQDISNKTFENAETTILEVARHTLSNNKNYLSGGPVPPNDLKNLYELKYQYGESKGRPSYRYRIVDNRDKNKTNFSEIKDYTKEETNGTMSLGNRGSISIDPWKSKGLIGCIGIRGENGINHPSCDSRMGDWNNKEKYKFIYHALNNYLETVIPELTGVYGRRGYNSTGEVNVSTSQYNNQTRVYVLVDSLPEISDCKCDLKKDGREDFYKEFGEAAIKMVEQKGKSNKFKGLYMVAQRRQENSFNLKVPNNNPMNIKGKGDLGQSDLYTTEYINGKAVKMNDGFANFSTVEKGFEGYLELLNKNFNDAYNSILDDEKTIDDFLNGMQDSGRLGAYATDPNYKTSIKTIFEGVISDYKKIYNCKLCKAKTENEKDEIKKDIELLNKLK